MPETSMYKGDNIDNLGQNSSAKNFFLYSIVRWIKENFFLERVLVRAVDKQNESLPFLITISGS